MDSMQWMMETGSGRNIPGWGIILLVCRNILSKVKVDGAHCVESWDRGPHGCKDMSRGADVFIYASLVYRMVIGVQDACTELVRKYLL